MGSPDFSGAANASGDRARMLRKMVFIVVEEEEVPGDQWSVVSWIPALLVGW